MNEFLKMLMFEFLGVDCYFFFKLFRVICENFDFDWKGKLEIGERKIIVYVIMFFCK